MEKEVYRLNLMRAIQIGIGILEYVIQNNIIEEDLENDIFRIEVYKKWLENVKQAKITKVALKYYEDDFFIYYNEGSGEEVEMFWKRIQEEGLPFQRKDILGKILKKKKISKREDYDFAIDTMIPFFQEG